MSQQQQNQTPTPQQVYQEFNKNELSLRQMFELIYNQYLLSQQKITILESEKSQLIEQLSQFTKQKTSEIKPNVKVKGKK